MLLVEKSPAGTNAREGNNSVNSPPWTTSSCGRFGMREKTVSCNQCRFCLTKNLFQRRRGAKDATRHTQEKIARYSVSLETLYRE